MRGAWTAAVLAGVLGGASATDGPIPPAAVVEQVEERLAARALAAENERLRAEVARLQEKQAELTVSLAEALAELDLARAREEKSRAGEVRRVEAGVRAAEARVLDVNPALKMVVLDAGRQAGLEPGLVFAVVRDGRAVARVRVTDVRERIAGAVLEGVANATPQRGDRVVLGR